MKGQEFACRELSLSPRLCNSRTGYSRCAAACTLGCDEIVRVWPGTDVKGSGRACPLSPGTSGVHLFGDGESVVHLNPEISHRAFDLLMSEKKLGRAEIAGSPIDERGLRPAQGVGPVGGWTPASLKRRSVNGRRMAAWEISLLISSCECPRNISPGSYHSRSLSVTFCGGQSLPRSMSSSTNPPGAIVERPTEPPNAARDETRRGSSRSPCGTPSRSCPEG